MVQADLEHPPNRHTGGETAEEYPPQLRTIAMLDLMRLECSYLNDRPVVHMDDLYRIAKPTTYGEANPLLKNALELTLDEQKRLRAENAQLRRELEEERAATRYTYRAGYEHGKAEPRS